MLIHVCWSVSLAILALADRGLEISARFQEGFLETTQDKDSNRPVILRG